jgi:tripartite-type tricarboxylate transporter receptor subunit TctC
VTLMMRQDFYLVVPAAMPAKNVQELIALSKSRAGGLFYGSVGNGSVHHLGFERIRQLTGANLVHVPYKGNAQMRGPLIAGEIDMTVAGITGVMDQLKAGQLRALAIAAPARSAELPDVPTLAEIGLPGVEINIGVGLVAPAATPRNIVQRMRDEIVKALADSELKRRNSALGFQIVANTPAEYEEKIRADLLQYRKIASDANITAN